jgi:hypothetical protein
LARSFIVAALKATILWLLIGSSPLFAAHARAADAETGDIAFLDKDSDAPPPDPKPSAGRNNFGHALQFGLRAGLLGGYDMVFRYNQSPYCTAPQADNATAPGVIKEPQNVCGHGAPPALDLALSFAPLDSVEPYLFLRLGLKGETESDTLPVRIFGAGARIYTMSDSPFKVFIEPALAAEFEGGGGAAAFQSNHPVYKDDVLIHLAAGPQLDFAKYVGVYIDAGLTTGVLRAVHTELELQGGVQARLP